MNPTLYSLTVRPKEGYYNQEWFTKTLLVVRTYSSKYIVAEESGDPNKPPNHIQAALWLNPEEGEAVKKAFQRAFADFPAESKSNKTKRMPVNPNAEKYVCKEDHHKVYEGYDEADILRLKCEYNEIIAQMDANYAHKMLARKIAVAVYGNCEDSDDIMEGSVSSICALCVYHGFLSTKEYSRAVRFSHLIKLNLEDMKTKWSEHRQRIYDEIRENHLEKLRVKSAEMAGQRDIAIREHVQSGNHKSHFCTRCSQVNAMYSPPSLDEVAIAKEVKLRVDSTDPCEVL